MPSNPIVIPLQFDPQLFNLAMCNLISFELYNKLIDLNLFLNTVTIGPSIEWMKSTFHFFIIHSFLIPFDPVC